MSDAKHTARERVGSGSDYVQKLQAANVAMASEIKQCIEDYGALHKLLVSTQIELNNLKETAGGAHHSRWCKNCKALANQRGAA